MADAWEAKFDPDEVKDYARDWDDLLDGDTIASSTWALPSVTNGLTIDTTKPVNGQPFSDTVSTVWLKVTDPATNRAAFVAKEAGYLLECTIVTAGMRTYQRSVKLKPKEL